MRISDWSSDVCSSDLAAARRRRPLTGANTETTTVGLMSETPPAGDNDVLVPSVVADDAETPHVSVESPGKVMRIGTMIKQLPEEVGAGTADGSGRVRLRDISRLARRLHVEQRERERRIGG